MKHWYAIPLAAILGVVAGSWGPREDMKRLSENAAQEKVGRRASTASGFDAFAHMVNIPDVAKRPAKKRPAAATNAMARATAPSGGVSAPTNSPLPRLSRKDLRARIEEAEDLWRTRVELARTQWKTKLGLADGAKADRFDRAVEAMNEHLLETMTALADEIARVEKMTPELALRLMGDASRVMAEAYDAIGEAVPADRRDTVSEVPVFEFIDPAVAEPLISVQDKLENMNWERARQ